MSTRTYALVSQQETGKITASIIPVTAGYHRVRASQHGCCNFVPFFSSRKFDGMRGVQSSIRLTQKAVRGSFDPDLDPAWPLNRGALDVGSNLRVFAENPVSRLTVWTPQREPQCAQPPHFRIRDFYATADESSCGRTMIDQHEAPLPCAPDELP
jgi:hypothetical protein